MKELKIFIADNQFVLREGVKSLLDQEDDLSLCGEAATGHDLLHCLQASTAIDCLILTPNLSDITLPFLLQELLQTAPELAILIFSALPENRDAVQFLKLGALGFIHTSSHKDDLLLAIRRVGHGHSYISPFLSDLLLASLRQPDIDKNLPHQNLSMRENQILRFLAQGYSVHHIAEELCLSHNTVRTYRSRVLKKMDLQNNVQLVKYSLQNNLV